MKHHTLSLTLYAGLLCAPLAAAPIKIEVPKRDKPVTFGEVKAVLNKSCTACHSASKKESGLSLETRETILKGGTNHGPAVVAGKSDKSPLLVFASHQDEPLMPPPDNKVNAKPLTPAELGLIKLWIDQGAAGGDASAAKVEFQPLPPGVNPIYAVTVSPDGRYAVCGRANQIFVYNVATGRLVSRLTDPAILKGGIYKQPGVAHLDLVQSLAFSPDGLRMASGGFQEIKIWARPTNVQTQKIAVATAGKALAISPDRKWLAAASGNNVLLIEAASGKTVRTLSGHAGPVTAVRFTPDNTKLFSGSADKTVRIWNVADGAAAGQIETLQPIAALTLVAAGKQVVTAGGDNLIYVWDPAAPPPKAPEVKKEAPKKDEKKQDEKKKDAKDDGKPKPLRTLTGHGQPVTSLDTIASADTQIISGSGDGTLRHWNTANGQAVRSFGHGAPIVAVAARADGQRFVSVSSNNTARLWNGTNGQPVAFNNQPDLRGDFRPQELVAKLTAAQQLATGEVNERKAAIDAAKKAAPPKAEAAKKAAEAVVAAEKTLKEKQAASAKVDADKAAAEKVLATAETALKAATDKAKAADDAAKKEPKNDGLKKAKADADKAAADAKKAQADADTKLKAVAKPLADATKALNDAQAAFNGAKRASELAALDLKAAQEAIPASEAALKVSEDKQKKVTAELDAAKKTATASDQPFSTVAFSPDGLEFAVGGNDKIVHTYSAETGQPLDVFEGHTGAVQGVAYTSETAIASLAADNQLIVWNTLPDWPLERTIGGASQPLADRVIALAFSPDGRVLASGGGEPSRSGEVKLWDVSSGKLVREIVDGHSDTVFGLEFSPDGSLLATCAADKFVKIWNVADGKWIKSFEGHTHHVMGVSWQFNAKVLVSCGADMAVKVWNYETGEQIRTLAQGGKQYTAIQFIPGTDNFVFATGNAQLLRRNTGGGGAGPGNYSGPSDFVYALDVNWNGGILAAGGQDSVLRVWTGAAAAPLRTFELPKPAGAQDVAKK
jgi:WD40 repeat protein